MVVGAVGVATIGEEDLGMDEDDWFARADAALYRAKARGRNMIEDENPIGRAVRTTPVERASA